jgi:hypothetical protein
MYELLQEIVDETIGEIAVGVREDGLNYPIPSSVAAKQVLARYDIANVLLQFRLYREMIEMQAHLGVAGDAQSLTGTSLRDFIGNAAEQQMGLREYRNLFERRMEDICPAAGAYGE